MRWIKPKHRPFACAAKAPTAATIMQGRVIRQWAKIAPLVRAIAPAVTIKNAKTASVSAIAHNKPCRSVSMGPAVTIRPV
jgi:hypothetical protein